MSEAEPAVIRSASNAQFKALRLLAHDSTAWRKQGRIWLEGDHLCRAALARGVQPESAVYAECCPADQRLPAPRSLVLADPLFAAVSALESPARMAFVIALPAAPALDPQASTVVLDRLQDAGNVGSVLRSAAAFGFRQVVALKGTAALWSPKVLRAGMGAHFGLTLFDAAEADVLDQLAVPLLVTSSHGGEALGRARLPWPCAWVLGHEGQGVSPEMEARADLKVRIEQPGGEESLNVAAAAAICLHASAAARPD
ncbi:TrmH family RNA methyltransferase [Ramlibacter sp. Leaf400]|uniref:TrmH family RNA methyltransferase n=1 Tax=Ramlibacter sp. Leaf400 TaxID=1736365 RepID=UPI0007019A45|nr:RNA methyltransferase [Ramlibacter sp. Leaf400]KQT07654.1 rRNA methyltransferase [Ramlibacter sp. Leaf400]